MTDLKDRLLSSIENHGKSDIHGIYQMYPHEKKISILRSFFILRDEGWIKIRKTRMQDGGRIKSPNVSRTRKQMYSQASLF